jgi:hypothetical protein
LAVLIIDGLTSTRALVDNNKAGSSHRRITGEEGLEHGYADRRRADGVFEYFGEGQVGHMRLRAGNRAIAEHSAQSKDLLLFRNTLDGLRFEGEMVFEDYSTSS